MLTWTELQTKAQRICGDTTSTTLTQLQQDMNVGYHRFNAALGRYFSRKQQFTNITVSQSIYQTPIDSVRIIGMTLNVGSSSTYSVPLKEIRSEFEWREIKAYPYSSNWPAYYFVLGSDEVEIWPTPSQTVTNGIRFYYQQQDHDLSIEDATSTSLAATVTATNGSATITATAGVFTANMIGLYFQLTSVNDLTWYEITGVPSATVLTLKSAFVGMSGAAQTFRIGQTWITPPEYSDVPIDYALERYFQSKNNSQRAAYHKSRYDSAIETAVEEYASSTEGNVIFDDGAYMNSWFVTPMPPTS